MLQNNQELKEVVLNTVKFINYLERIVAIVDISCLAVLTILSLIKGTDIDILFCLSVLICFWVSILLFQNGYYKEYCVEENNKKRKSWIYFLLLSAIFILVVENYMFYEELIKYRSGTSCVIAAIASYTLFESVHKYIIRKE